MSKYGYSINLDERGEFFADVRAIVGDSIMEIHGFSMFEDGFMKDKNDLQGLKKYLLECGKIEAHDEVVPLDEAEKSWEGLIGLLIRNSGVVVSLSGAPKLGKEFAERYLKIYGHDLINMEEATELGDSLNSPTKYQLSTAFYNDIQSTVSQIPLAMFHPKSDRAAVREAIMKSFAKEVDRYIQAADIPAIRAATQEGTAPAM